MAGGEEHPQFICPSIQLLLSLAQFGFVVVVMLFHRKVETNTRSPAGYGKLLTFLSELPFARGEPCLSSHPGEH